VHGSPVMQARHIEVHGASKTAIAAIEKAGGTVKILAVPKKDEGEAA